MKQDNKHIDKRLDLEKLARKSIFSVSDNYFESLPTRIQDKVVDLERKNQPSFRLTRAVKFALPVIAFIIMSIYFGLRIDNSDVDVQAMIDQVSTDELVAYLNDSELSTDEILSIIDLNELDIDGMLDEDIIFLDDSDFEEILEDYQEFENEI